MAGDFKKPYKSFIPIIPTMTSASSGGVRVETINGTWHDKQAPYKMFDNTSDFVFMTKYNILTLIFDSKVFNVELLRIYNTSTNAKSVKIHIADAETGPFVEVGTYSIVAPNDSDLDVAIKRISFKVIRFTFDVDYFMIRELQLYARANTNLSLLEFNSGLYTLSDTSIDMVSPTISTDAKTYEQKGFAPTAFEKGLTINGKNVNTNDVLRTMTDKFKIQVLKI